MARPRKQTVDYFPHDCDHGKTMFIIEQKFGNDGYVMWFKLLEMLGKTEGHFIDLNNESDWEFLTSVCRIQGDLCRRILNLLAKLGAIDPELWEQNIVWSQNFVSRISDAYRKRTSEIPKRPDNYRKKSLSEAQTDGNPPEEGGINPQTKLKESKVKESIGKKSTTPTFPEIKKPKKKKTTIPLDFKISDRVKSWAHKKGLHQLDQHLESFALKCKAKGYEYIDWDEAFMEAIRANWAQLKNQEPQSGPGPQNAYTICPACKREVLPADLTELACLKCERTPTGTTALKKINEILQGKTVEGGYG